MGRPGAGLGAHRATRAGGAWGRAMRRLGLEYWLGLAFVAGLLLSVVCVLFGALGLGKVALFLLAAPAFLGSAVLRLVKGVAWFAAGVRGGARRDP